MIGSLSFSRGFILPDLGMTPSTGPGSAAAASSEGFGAVLKSLVNSSSDVLRQGEAAAIGGIEGSLPVQTVVDKVMAAEQTLQTTLAVRDKLVSSFLEISRMQI